MSPSDFDSTSPGFNFHGLRTRGDGIISDSISWKIGAMSGIFVLSLLASAFPTLSKRVPFLRIHHIVFFILKHFGTGVILSTAFVHLLQDAFVVLLSNPKASALKNWVGLLVLASLLTIFFVEYISMTYVERLEGGNGEGHHHHWPAPSSSSTRRSTIAGLDSSSQGHHPGPHPQSRTSLPPLPENDCNEYDSGAPAKVLAETAPLLTSSISSPAVEHAGYRTWHARSRPSPLLESNLSSPVRARSMAFVPVDDRTHHGLHVDSEPYFTGHHRYEEISSHSSHHAPVRRTPSIISFQDSLSGDNRAIMKQTAHHEDLHDDAELEDDADLRYNVNHEEKIDEKRQIVNILVLQIGIMFHSLIIGLTLSVKSGPEFTSLLIAVLFHQLFEGLSLGVRIASLPSSTIRGCLTVSLKFILTILFSVTAPVGILLGLLTFARGSSRESMRLIQGIMSAMSAGMLIYAACIEMLAADFVMDPQLKRSSFSLQALAMFSLLMGMTGMALIAL